MTLLIGGGSCSGKSTLARAIAAETGWPVIHLDAFFRRGQPGAPLIEVDGECVFDCNHPDTIDLPLALESIRSTPEPRIIEGHFALTYSELRELATHSVFVDCPAEIREARRLARDCPAKGTEAQVLAYYRACAVPGFEKYIWPSRQHADLIVDGSLPAMPLPESLTKILSI